MITEVAHLIYVNFALSQRSPLFLAVFINLVLSCSQIRCELRPAERFVLREMGTRLNFHVTSTSPERSKFVSSNMAATP